MQEVSSIVNSFIRSDLDALFEKLFVSKDEYEKFIKKYFKKISRFISKSMMPKYLKLYPSHAALIKPNEVRKDTNEIKVYKVIKTWSK